MIEINLLAASPGAALPREWLPPEQRSALLGLALLICTAAASGGGWAYLHHQRTQLQLKIGTAEQNLVRLKDAAKLVDQITARKTELSERLGLIGRLRAAKREPVRLLETLSRSVPDGLWLVEIKQSGTSIQVDGRATSLTSVTDFAEQMQNSGLFRRPVEILTTSTETVEEQSVIRFSVRADAETTPIPLGSGTGASPAISGTTTTAGAPGATLASAVPAASGM